MKNNTNEKEFLNTILSDTSEEESLVHKIKIVGPWPDDYGIYYYYQINGRGINNEHVMKTNTIRILELKNVLAQYKRTIYLKMLLIRLLRAEKRVLEEYQNLKGEIKDLEEASINICHSIKEYDDYLSTGNYLYLDTGCKEAKNRFSKALKPNK